jgi:hypothetical protein
MGKGGFRANIRSHLGILENRIKKPGLFLYQLFHGFLAQCHPNR